MSLSLRTVACSSIPLKQSPGATARQRREWMHPQSTDGRTLRLHSCRALSSQPQGYFTPPNQSFQAFPLTNHIPVPSVAKPLPALDKPRRRALDSTVSAISLSSCRRAFLSRAPCAGPPPAASATPPASSLLPPVSSLHPCPSTLNFLRPAGRGSLGRCLT